METEYQDIANSGGKKETKAIIFHKMNTEEISDRYVAPCFVNGIEEYDGEINLGLEENMISNEFAVKLCLDHEFIINPKEDDVEPMVVIGRAFMRLTKGIADFGNGTVTIYPELDPFLDSYGEEEKIGDDWDLLLDNLDFGDILDIEGVKIPPFVCKMRKNSRSKRKQLQKFQLIYSDKGPLVSTGKPLTREEAEREALVVGICEIYSLLEEERPVIETMAYSDKYKKILDGICLDKMKLDGEMKKEEEAIIKIKGEVLKKRGSWSICDPDPDGRAYRASEGCPVPAKTSLNIAESDSDDGEEYAFQRNKFGAPIYGLKPVPLQHVDWKPDYTGCFNKKEEGDGQWHAEIRLTAPYGNTMGSHDDEAGSSRSKHSRQHETVEKVMPLRVHHPYLLWEVCNQAARSRYNTRLGQLLLRLIYSACVLDWNVLNQIGCGEAIDEMLTIKLFMADTNEEIFTSEARTNAFNIDERIYSELCHEFYSTYEFDDVCAAAELKTKKIIKLRLCGHAFSWTLLKFAKRLGLYNSEEIKDEGFDVYFQGGLCSDEHFNAQEYWLSISREENLSLSRSHASTIRNPVLMVLHKMITYGLCQRTTGEIYEEERSWLIPEAPKPGVPRVSIPRPPRASMQDLYERTGNMKICPGAIKRMEPITHLDMIRSSMTSIISSIHLSSSSFQMMMSSVEMT
ncbi:hypothetical protein Tco_1151948 [Tanacetum coccineum]